MADFFATIIDFVRGIIEPIFRFIFESILWVIIFFRDLLVQTGIVDSVITATVIPIVVLLGIFLVLVGWIWGPIRRTYGSD
ncbi:hypothetical protein [Oceanobacillus profundus]|uniref:Uncharacterized protein n=1 Tax=Oceanobacillus profundus TaxID=372463 RepID=A0A417YJJ1_9BACI|nr:hypothetical protein [Oceanobacillus profundus]RHW33104.1 hypothetical protein D1B32_08650 [Oceanobacillus profundus]